jgi:hypothetical protein
MQLLHLRGYLFPIAFAFYSKAYCSYKPCCQKNGLLRFDEKGPCLRVSMLGNRDFFLELF